MLKVAKQYCMEIGNDTDVLQRFIRGRMAKVAAAPPSLRLLQQARVYGVFQEERMVGGFAFFLGPDLPLTRLIQGDRSMQGALARARSRASCEIGCVWLNNPLGDRKLSALLWMGVLRAALRVGRRSLYFCYDTNSERMKKLYRLGVAAELGQVKCGTGQDSLLLAVCRTSLAKIVLNTALCLARRELRAMGRRTLRALCRPTLAFPSPGRTSSAGSDRP